MPSASIRELIALNLLASCQGITVTAGFQNNLAVYRPTMEPISPLDRTAVITEGKAQDLPAPWNLKAQRLWFGVTFYGRPSEASSASIDGYLNSIASDLEKAVMTDPRRGGLTDIDTVCHDAQKFNGKQPGVLVGIMPVSVVCRTMRNDPTVQAPAAGNELFFQGGAVLHLARYLDYRGPYSALSKWTRWADLRITPTGKPKLDGARNDRDGLSRPASIKAAAWNQQYEIETQDFSPQAMDLAMGGTGVQSYTQSGLAMNDISLLCMGSDSVMVLTDASGNPLYGVSSIASVTGAGGTPTYDSGTDYIADGESLAEGILRIPPGSSIPAGNVLVSMTPGAISGQRLVQGQATDEIRYRARILWPSYARAGVATQLVVHGPMDAAIVPKTARRDGGDYSSQKFDLIVLDDFSDTTGGQLILPLGMMPAQGS